MAAAPFLVEVERLKTALVANLMPPLGNGVSKPTSKHFLPADSSHLARTVHDIVATFGDYNYNIRIVVTTLLREAAALRRNPCESLRTRITALEGHISTVWKALPDGFMEPEQHDMVDSDHHLSRLSSVLAIHFARLIVTRPSGILRDESEWLYRWHRTVGYCEDIVSVLSHWNEQPSSFVDPAVWIMASGILILLHLQSCSITAEAASRERLVARKHTLLTLMSHSASTWQLSRCLLSSYEKFSQLASSQLAPRDVDQIMTSSQGPLHENVCNLFSLSSEDVE